MLRYRARHLGLSAFLLLSFSAAAFADSVQGRVANVSSSALDMTVYDNQGRPYQNALRLKVGSFTRYGGGVSSASQLRRNDPIGAQVSQEKTGVWRADAISLLKETRTIQSTAARPSPSLAGALGNPIVRNALVGAATGAIASSASGGKAGKGALVGAGVGVAGGLLADMFSQRSQSQSSSTTVTSQEDSRY